MTKSLFPHLPLIYLLLTSLSLLSHSLDVCHCHSHFICLFLCNACCCTRTQGLETEENLSKRLTDCTTVRLLRAGVLIVDMQIWITWASVETETLETPGDELRHRVSCCFLVQC